MSSLDEFFTQTHLWDALMPVSNKKKRVIGELINLKNVYSFTDKNIQQS